MNKYQMIEGLKRRLTDPESAYSFESYPVSEYSETDFNFLSTIDATVNFKFRKGFLFDTEVFYVTTEPKAGHKTTHKPTLLTKPDKIKRIRKGWCYLISDGEYQKIGISTSNVTKRVAQIQNGNPKHIDIIAIYEIPTDVFSLEKYLHSIFYKNRLKGEWFNTNISREEFLQLCKKYEKENT